MERRKPLTADPAKTRAWQRRSVERAQFARNAREPHERVENRKTSRSRPRNDGPWRAECIATYGEWCRACGTSRDVQMDHLKPRSQRGPSVVENGLPLCRTHHEAKTSGTLQIRYEWLTARQVEWLALVGWVEWDVVGEPSGQGWKHFAPRWSRA